MHGHDAPSSLKILAVIFAVVLGGSAVRLLLVHLPSAIDASPGCEIVTDFWNGDQILCLAPVFL